jgi:hypothetical protein
MQQALACCMQLNFVYFMRIIGYLEHAYLKITVFQMDNRISVKFENDFAEQTFKLRIQEGLANLSDVKALIDPEFTAQVEARFAQMRQQLSVALERKLPPSNDDIFENII